jgi:hypothetical protein
MLGVALPLRPALDLNEINWMPRGDEHRLVQSLTIPPEVEGREAVHHTLRRGQDPDRHLPHRQLHPVADQLATDRERPRWKLERVRNGIVNVVAS